MWVVETMTAQDIILAPGSVPVRPTRRRGRRRDRVYTSDEGLELKHVPEYCAIIGSGIIGLEFADVYTALGAECTVIEALPKLMPAFDREIAKTAERLLLTNRGVDYRTNVFASKVTPGKIGEKPVIIEMIDATTKEHVETLEVDACMVATGRVPNTKKLGLEEAGIEAPRGFVQVNDKMQVLDKPDGEVVPHLYCIGDANGIQMLAHTASTQGVSPRSRTFAGGPTSWTTSPFLRRASRIPRSPKLVLMRMRPPNGRRRRVLSSVKPESVTSGELQSAFSGRGRHDGARKYYSGGTRSRSWACTSSGCTRRT